MPNLIDFMERATSGPIVLEDDFNMKHLIPNIRKIVQDFNIDYTPGNPVPADDDLADRLFEAAVEFVVRTGVYCDDTNRVIQFERDEIKDAIENLPAGSYFGEGRERRLFMSRKPEDERTPWCHVGTGIVATSEDIALAQVKVTGAFPRLIPSVSQRLIAFGACRLSAVLRSRSTPPSARSRPGEKGSPKPDDQGFPFST